MASCLRNHRPSVRRDEKKLENIGDFTYIPTVGTIPHNSCSWHAVDSCIMDFWMIYDDLRWSMMIFLNISRWSLCSSKGHGESLGLGGTARGPPGDRQVLVFNASKASKEGGVLACSSLFIQLSTSYQMFWDLSISVDFPIYKIAKEKQLGQIPGASSH